MDSREALGKARELSLDLVEIAPKAEPPVVKIVDFKKFKYEESKKEQETKKKTREIDTKEIWLGPLISDHDLTVRADQAKHFLLTGDLVKLTIRFAGREIAHPEFGYKVLEKAFNALSAVAEKDGEPRWLGRSLNLRLKPLKKENKTNETKN